MERAAHIALNSYIAVGHLLPVRQRLALTSWLVRRIAAPRLGWFDRIAANLDLVWPDLSAARKSEIAEQSIDNLARALIENYYPTEMLKRGAAFPVSGPGLPILEQAKADGTPVILITGHYGSPICARAALVARGYTVAGLLRPMSNAFMNARYIRNYREVGEPVFEQGRRGTIGLVKHIREGGIAAMAFDVFESSGAMIDFLGHPAPTATSPADIALKTKAILLPYFGVRRSDRYGFDAIIEEPVPHSDPVTMMTEVTKRLEARIEADPGQWMWSHRRWKPKRVAKRMRKAAQAADQK